MQLFNTLTRQTEKIVAYKPPHLGVYTCGPTVYDYTHIGHVRKYTMDDVLIRTLKHAGFDVKHVMNLTDVGHLTSDSDTGEDKLEKGAAKYGKSVWDIAQKFTDFFFHSMDLIGNNRPDESPKPTEHIPEQIELVKRLEAKGFTYEIPGDGIYFDTAQFPEYGKLARRKAEDIKEGARIGIVEGKRNPTDFAVWKFEREGENRQMAWKSPWAERGFPGWHLECSVLGQKYLGEQFEIHTGGVDHISVHHPNEIAQSEAATGKKPFVKYWVHHNFLLIEGEKMSKSLNNFFTIDDVVERGFHPMALRLYYLGAHYRSEMNFTWKNLKGAEKSWEKLVKMAAEWQMDVESKNSETKSSVDQPRANRIKLSSDAEQLSDKAQQLSSQFWQAMENDLKTPEAMAILWQVTKSQLPAEEKLALLLDFDQVLGLQLEKSRQFVSGIDRVSASISNGDLPGKVQRLLARRQEARDAKDWDGADQLREKIEKMGYRIIDDQAGRKVVRPVVSNEN